MPFLQTRPYSWVPSGYRLGLRLNCTGGGGAADQLNASADGCTLLDGEPAGVDVAVYDGGLTQLDAAGGVDIAFYQAENNDVADVEVGGDVRIGAYGEAASGKRDGTVELAVEEQILTSGELTFDADRLADERGTFCWGHYNPFKTVRKQGAGRSQRMKRTIPIHPHRGKPANVAYKVRVILVLIAEGRGGINLGDCVRIAAAMLIGIASIVLPAARAQQTMPDPMSLAPKKWATDAAANEVKVIDYDRHYVRYRIHIRDAKGDQTRDVIESRDGAVARVIFREGRALTKEEDDGEHERLQAMLESPAAFAKHVKGDVSGRRMGAELIKLLPEAMLYSYAPGQPQRAGRAEGEPPEIVLDYKPNPAWNPPTIASGALTGVEGRAWIDPRTHYMTRMEGTIFKPINFGLFLAHIFPGGKLEFEQVKVSDQRWLFSRFVEHITLRVIVKTLKEEQNTETSNYAMVPEMSYQEAIRILMETPLPKN